MKKKKGFTLIELLAVIVILAIIALISTPIIIGVIDKARKGAFENTAYGVYDAATLYFTDKLSDERKFEGKNFDFRENTDELRISGEKPKEGYVSIDQNGVVSLAISNDRWCTRINAGNKKAITTDGKCAEKSLKETIEGDTAHIVKNTTVNGETVNKVKGTKDEKLTMKNYVWYSGQLWQVMETNDSKHTIKLITAQSITTIPYGETNDFNTSWVKKWLNKDRFYPILENKEYIVESDFCAQEPETTSTQLVTPEEHTILSLTGHTPISSCTNKVKTKVGLMTFEDYAYAQNGNTASYLGGSFLDEDEFTWTMTPYTKGGKNNQMWIQWYTNGYLTIKVNSGNWSLTNGYGHGVRPVINVKDNVMIESGTGTKSDPYVLFGEKKVVSDGLLNNAKVGDYVYLDESKNPNTFTSETVARDLSYNTTKDKVRYRIVIKEGDGGVKVERADVLRNLPDTIAVNSGYNVPYYYSSTCGYINSAWVTSGCTNHNLFLPNEGTGDYKYTDSENIGYFLNNASNSFYNWYSDKTTEMIRESEWDLVTSGHGKDYANLNNGTSRDYPGRTTDGNAKAKVGLPSWGEMYTGNDLNYTYWLLNRWQGSSSHVAGVYTHGHVDGHYAGNPWMAVRPVVRLKSEVKIVSGSGTMTDPYILTI